jgi:hypothetical protein
MNLNRSTPARIGVVIVASAMILIGAGCHHKTADDKLAEGDADMQANQLPQAEVAYLDAEKLAPNDPRFISRLEIFTCSSTRGATRKSSS